MARLYNSLMVDVAQLGRAPGCGPGGRGFKSLRSPHKTMNTNIPFIIIISGPSGVGKGTIIKEVLKQNPQSRIAVSATTRLPRPTEEAGKDYYFLSEEEFDVKIQQNDFLEWSLVHNNKYGTLKSEVEYYLNNGYDVILEIDIQGAHQIKKSHTRVISIFITPPTFQALIERLQGRNTDHSDVIKHRLAAAGRELSAIGQYDYIVVNKDIPTAIQEVCEIIRQVKNQII